MTTTAIEDTKTKLEAAHKALEHAKKRTLVARARRGELEARKPAILARTNDPKRREALIALHMEIAEATADLEIAEADEAKAETEAEATARAVLKAERDELVARGGDIFPRVRERYVRQLLALESAAWAAWAELRLICSEHNGRVQRENEIAKALGEAPKLMAHDPDDWRVALNRMFAQIRTGEERGNVAIEALFGAIGSWDVWAKNETTGAIEKRTHPLLRNAEQYERAGQLASFLTND